MKTENFDDAIRRKIENISPQYDENDIDRTLDYVANRRASTSRRRYGAIFLASFIGLMMIGLLTWNLSERRKQKQLVETIDSLKNKLASRVLGTAVVKDTVYVTKYITETNADKQNGVKQTKNGTGSNLLAVKEISKSDVIASPARAGEAIPINRKMASSSAMAAKENQFANSKTSLSESKNDVAYKSNLTGNANNPEPSLQGTEQSQSIEQGIASSGTPRNDSSLGGGASEVSRDAEPSSGTPRNDSTNIAKHDNSTELNDAQNKSSDSSATEGKNHQPLFSFLKKMYYQAGIGYEMADALSAYSISGEAYFKRNWSVSLGLRLATVNNEDYDDDNDFDHKKGKHFYQAYGSETPDTSAFSHISIHTTLLQIPVKINYHIPLNNYLSLVVGVGTDIDLYAKQHVGYHHKEINNVDTLKSFDAGQRTLLFNNAGLTAGIQGQWKRFVLQITPFISQQVISVPYKKNDLVFGAGSRLLYAF